MSTSQRARSGVPLDQRSVLATVPGVPAWGAVAIAAGATALGFVIDATRGTELTSAFSFLYVVGCVAAVLLVRFRGIFTAMVQAPLILFIAVPMAYQYFTENAGTGLRDILLNVAIPLVNRFPVMLLGTALAVGIGLVRIFLKRQSTHAPAVKPRKEKKAPRAERAPRADRSSTDQQDPSARQGRTTRRRETDRDDPARDASRREPYSSRDAREQPVREHTARESRAPREPLEPRRARPRNDDAPRRENYEQPLRAAAPRPEPRPRPVAPPPVRKPRRPQPPRQVPDPYSAQRPDYGQRTEYTPRPDSADIPPHPVPQVRYRDRTD